jgi:hypothetical protein
MAGTYDAQMLCAGQTSILSPAHFAAISTGTLYSTMTLIPSIKPERMR